MAQRDLKNHIQIANGLTIDSASGTVVDGNIVDTQGFESITWGIIINSVPVGSLGYVGNKRYVRLTASTAGPVVEESDTTVDGDFTAVADGDLLGSEADFAIASGNPVSAIAIKASADIQPPVGGAADIAAT